MPITIRQLEVFEKVALCGQVTKAGEELYLSQAAVSMSLAELGNCVGGPLFERIGRQLVLNERGRLLLPEAQEILRRVRNLGNLLNDSLEGPVGILQVGASTTIANYLLPFLLGDFMRMYPQARTVLQVGNTQQIENALLRGDLDLGLIEGPCHSPQLECIRWRNDELVIIAGEQHPWSQSRTVTDEMLAQADWIMREKGSGTREVFEESMAGKQISYSIAMELGHTEAIKKAVQAGMGVSCLSRLAVERELADNLLVEVISDLDLRRDLTILHRKTDYHTKIFTVFADYLTASSDMCRT